MKTIEHFSEDAVLHELEHFLPAQAPLKDFIHHNTLHGFQHYRFNEAVSYASKLFGYKTQYSVNQFRRLFEKGLIHENVIAGLMKERDKQGPEWRTRIFEKHYDQQVHPEVGSLRSNWKKIYKLDLDSLVHPLLFRIICSYLDQGIAMWNFPGKESGFLSSIRELEKNSFTSFFKTHDAKEQLLKGDVDLSFLLNRIVGDPELFRHYLFDQQFAHPGWSGMVSTVATHPDSLLSQRSINLKEFIYFELLLEKDALDNKFGHGWKPLGTCVSSADYLPISGSPVTNEYDEVLSFWQEAFEWSYYDEVLAGVSSLRACDEAEGARFQAFFCIDDREFSIRHYLEKVAPGCQTFGTPGFFNSPFYFKPLGGKFVAKLAPAPAVCTHLITETGSRTHEQKDIHFSKASHSLFRGWLITQTLGFWAALKIFINIFMPRTNPATAASLRHMNLEAGLTVKHTKGGFEDGLQVGFTVPEMVDIVGSLLKSAGLTKNIAPLIYIVGHGSSSVNNPHYAAYDCGACSGRPGSVNARVFATMANDPDVRKQLSEKGIIIPHETQFLGALHDTTRDEITFFDTEILSPENKKAHQSNEKDFNSALDLNAKERSRRFETIRTHADARDVHRKILGRSVSLFEPRPELNHATNSLCIIGRRYLSKHLFLDRRAFLNSYDYRLDDDGSILLGILKAAAPVCGGINLEYFFSRTDNQKLGAGTKLPHNVMGLIGVANGTDGDLRTGLPSQMIEVHDPVRLLMIIEQFPERILDLFSRSHETADWFTLEWIHLVAVHPETNALYQFRNGKFELYTPLTKQVMHTDNVESLIESTSENIPVHIID